MHESTISFRQIAQTSFVTSHSHSRKTFIFFVLKIISEFSEPKIKIKLKLKLKLQIKKLQINTTPQRLHHRRSQTHQIQKFCHYLQVLHQAKNGFQTNADTFRHSHD